MVGRPPAPHNVIPERGTTMAEDVARTRSGRGAVHTGGTTLHLKTPYRGVTIFQGFEGITDDNTRGLNMGWSKILEHV